MMARIAAALLIVSQVLLMWVALAPSGESAIWFMFVGHPIVLVGSVLALIALTRRLARERAARKRIAGAPEPLAADGSGAPS